MGQVPCYCIRCRGRLVCTKTRANHRDRPRDPKHKLETYSEWKQRTGASHTPPQIQVQQRRQQSEVPLSPPHVDANLATQNRQELVENGLHDPPAAAPDLPTVETAEIDVDEGNMSDGEEDNVEVPDAGCIADVERQDAAEEAPPPLAPEGPRNEERDQDIDTPEALPPPLSAIESVRLTQEYIRLIESATLETAMLDDDTLERLRDPPQHPVDISDPDTRLSLDIFLATSNASEETYHAVRRGILRYFPTSAILSYHAVKKVVAEISGVVSVAEDMCINSCHAFTGPLAHRDTCYICGEHRYDQDQLRLHKKKSCDTLLYRDKKSKAVLDMISELNDASDMVYDDIFCGSDYLKLLKEANLTKDDILVSGSLDGAQLYQNKASDTWIFIWIIEDIAPGSRYKKKHVLPGVFIPGPSKPKMIDSFTFRGLHHVSALQRENDGRGMKVWDARRDEMIYSRVGFLFATADAVGIPEADGRVGHHGAHSCRLGCPMRGRHKPHTGHYHSAHLRPNDGQPGSNHPDTDIRNIPTADATRYNNDLNLVIASRDGGAFERNRRDTGLSKPSLISGLRRDLSFTPPRCFVLDLMHLLQLNIPELLVSLWRGSMRCEPTDSKRNWPWVTLTGNTWTSHGKAIASATKYFPSSFHRPPRNPAEKINSGFKATEWFLYVFGLGPGHFRAILPRQFWRNFCKLVRGVHISLQRSISGKQLREAHTCFIEFVEEYEQLYYQRRLDRLHFCRPCIHTLLHIAPETARVGPGCYYTQFTIERTIGDLGQEVKQPSNPFSNLSNRGMRRAQVNALQVMCPELASEAGPTFPERLRELGGGYTLLRAKDKLPHRLPVGPEATAVFAALSVISITRWSRLQLPNGQIARSAWREKLKREDELRVTRMVQIIFENQSPLRGYALLSLFSLPNDDIRQDSFGVLRACSYQGDQDLHVVPVSSIKSVVSMQPLPHVPGDTPDLWFVVDKPGLDDGEFAQQILPPT
ncbi:hypothetical protein ONZ45_g14448 [Pleurotus djamor]|nr:hypothetical protein ONZ45_g14448 [Pleurotus djamor]